MINSDHTLSKGDLTMKRFLLFALCCLLLSGCMQNEPAPPTTPVVTETPTQAATAAPVTTPNTAPEEVSTEAAPVSLTVYRGDDNAESFVSEEVLVSEINETVIVEQLIAAGVLKEGTAVNELRMDGTQLTIDFNQPFADLIRSMGTSGEHIIVGSTVNTFLCAYGADVLMFTVDGEILESGHVVYDFPLTFTD